MGQDSFQTYLGANTYKDLEDKYTALVSAKKAVTLNTVTSIASSGVYWIAIPFIFNDN